MDVWTAGADIGTMLTGLSAVTAAYVWTRNQVRERRQWKAETSARNWHGYIEVGGINSWHVRLAEDPKEPTARVVLDVVDREGNPDMSMANNMRQRSIVDGMLARVPTTEEYDFLIALRKERGYGKGFVVRQPTPYRAVCRCAQVALPVHRPLLLIGGELFSAS